MFSYYRRFIPDFSKIAYSLFKLLQKDIKFEWGEPEKTAFEPFIVTTDASDFVLGAILSQGKIGVDHPCAYASRCLKCSELRYPTYDKELLAVVFAKEQFTCCLYCRKWTLVTDHEPLKHFHTSKKPDLRFNRLKAALNGYDFDVIYRPGIKNANADALSRNPVLAKGEVNPDLPRHELYELAGKSFPCACRKEAKSKCGRRRARVDIKLRRFLKSRNKQKASTR